MQWIWTFYYYFLVVQTIKIAQIIQGNIKIYNMKKLKVKCIGKNSKYMQILNTDKKLLHPCSWFCHKHIKQRSFMELIIYFKIIFCKKWSNFFCWCQQSAIDFCHILPSPNDCTAFYTQILQDICTTGHFRLLQLCSHKISMRISPLLQFIHKLSIPFS